MKVVQIGTYDKTGGAARAMYRLHKGLRNSGWECSILAVFGKFEDARVFQVKDGTAIGSAPEDKWRSPFEREEFRCFLTHAHYVEIHRTAMSNTLFSIYRPGFDLSDLPLVRNADLIHLHWITGILTPFSVKKILDLGKPVVWTFHDQWAFTGGCHYSAGCEKYRQTCAECPQLGKDPFDIVKTAFADKLELFNHPNLTVVTPSRWMADCASESTLFKEHRIEPIPNSIETDIYAPMDKKRAKKMLGIPAHCRTILAGAFQGDERRKGFSELAAALKHSLDHAAFREMAQREEIRVVFFGDAHDALDDLQLPTHFCGFLDTDEKIRTAYCAADVFVLPSLEDNFPNTMLESMSCGTPVIGFDIGGVSEGVIDGETGRIVPEGDVRKFGEAIVELILNDDFRVTLGQKARNRTLAEYPLIVQAKRHITLYEELLNAAGRKQDAESQPEGAENRGEVTAQLEKTIGPLLGPVIDSAFFQALQSLNENRNTLIGQLRGKEEEVLRLHAFGERREEFIRQLSGQIEESRHLYQSEIQHLNLLLEEQNKRMSALEAIAELRLNILQRQDRMIQTFKRWNPILRIKEFLEPRLGTLHHHDPRPMHIPKNYNKVTFLENFPSISLVTPSFNQADFIERTIQSVIDQKYPKLEYRIIDGGSDDGTIEILQKLDRETVSWVSEKDEGQADAINKGFQDTKGEIMAYLNSDDLLLPGSLHYIARYFHEHPDIDVVYGHRILINGNGDEIGRWVMPPHDDDVLSWADFIPQETMFWRRRIWEKSGGFIDRKLKFAIDWDLLLRFRDAGAKFKRLPRFLGAFRVHAAQKTIREMGDQGTEEMKKLRKQCHGRDITDFEVSQHIKSYLRRHVICGKLFRMGIFRY